MIQLDKQGLIPAIIQDADTNVVIMLGYISPGSLKKTLTSGDVWFYSRSRNDLWHKGEESGNSLRVKSITLDCDGDALLLKVDPIGPTCHTGNRTCFFKPLGTLPQFNFHETGPNIINELFSVIQERKHEMPEGSYTAQLFREGIERISQKVIEEAGETAIAGTTKNKEHVLSETADLVYHTLVLLAASGVNPDDVWKRLSKRRK